MLAHHSMNANRYIKEKPVTSGNILAFKIKNVKNIRRLAVSNAFHTFFDQITRYGLALKA